MIARSLLVPLALLALGIGPACGSKEAEDSCSPPCGSGAVCVGRVCKRLCSEESHCGAGEICDLAAGYCVPGNPGSDVVVRGGTTLGRQTSSGGAYEVRGGVVPYGGIAEGGGVKVLPALD